MRQKLTQGEIDKANYMAEMMASELNVKELHFPVGTGEDNVDGIRKSILVMYKHDTVQDEPEAVLDVYLGGKAQHNFELAAFLFQQTLFKSIIEPSNL